MKITDDLFGSQKQTTCNIDPESSTPIVPVNTIIGNIGLVNKILSEQFQKTTITNEDYSYDIIGFEMCIRVTHDSRETTLTPLIKLNER